MFKKILKVIGLLLAVVIVVGGLFLAHTWYFKPVNINLFFGRTMLQIMLQSPEMLSSLHVLEPLGITGHNAKLDDESLAAGDRFLTQLKEANRVLKTYEDEDLSAADLMSKRIAATLLGDVPSSQKRRSRIPLISSSLPAGSFRRSYSGAIRSSSLSEETTRSGR